MTETIQIDRYDVLSRKQLPSEAEAIALVVSHEGHIAKLEGENRELREALEGQSRWIKRHLETTLVHKTTTYDGLGRAVNGYAHICPPDWECRQRLDYILEALGNTVAEGSK